MNYEENTTDTVAPAQPEEVMDLTDVAEDDVKATGSESRVREVLESNNAWMAMVNLPGVRECLRYTDEGIEEVGVCLPRELRHRLYQAAHAILGANDVRHDTQHEAPFYVRAVE